MRRPSDQVSRYIQVSRRILPYLVNSTNERMEFFDDRNLQLQPVQLRACLHLRRCFRPCRQGMRMRPFLQVWPRLQLREMIVAGRSAHPVSVLAHAGRKPIECSATLSAPDSLRKGPNVPKTIIITLCAGAMAICALQASAARSCMPRGGAECSASETRPGAADRSAFSFTLSVGTILHISLSLDK
jgi:hypothetical protein